MIDFFGGYPLRKPKEVPSNLRARPGDEVDEKIFLDFEKKEPTAVEDGGLGDGEWEIQTIYLIRGGIT